MCGDRAGRGSSTAVRRPLARSRRRSSSPLWLGCFCLASAQAQVEREYFARTQPYPVYRSPEATQYNLKLGKLTAKLWGNVQFELNDNINLSENDPKMDFSIGPQLGVGFLWPLTKNHVMQLDMAVGYRWYVNYPDASSVAVAPHTHLDYTVFIEDVRLVFRDRFSIQVDPITRGELSGPSGKVTSFRRLINVCGVNADWQATTDLDLYAGYDFAIDRSLTGDFKEIDRNDHSVYSGFNYRLTPRLTGGVTGSYSVSQYLVNVQNDGSSYSVGPTVALKMSKFITGTASVSYTVSDFSRTGAVADESGYEGITFQVGATHTINRRTSQNLRFGQSVGLGLGSNYTRLFFMQYGFNTMLTRSISMNAIVAYENLESSARRLGGDAANRYLLYLGTGYAFTRNWSAGLSYSLGIKDSDQPGRDYLQNRVTVDVTRKF